jgi:hypothetical protein
MWWLLLCRVEMDGMDFMDLEETGQRSSGWPCPTGRAITVHRVHQVHSVHDC